MTLTVKLEGGVSSDSIPLVLSLYYESEKRVEEREQNILQVIGRSSEELQIASGSTTCSFKFRLEKVSRRKDGQKFKVRVDVDVTKTRPELLPIEGCYCSPVTVLSKRKHLMGSAGQSSAASIAPSHAPTSRSHYQVPTGPASISSLAVGSKRSRAVDASGDDSDDFDSGGFKRQRYGEFESGGPGHADSAMVLHTLQSMSNRIEELFKVVVSQNQQIEDLRGVIAMRGGSNNGMGGRRLHPNIGLTSGLSGVSVGAVPSSAYSPSSHYTMGQANGAVGLPSSLLHGGLGAASSSGASLFDSTFPISAGSLPITPSTSGQAGGGIRGGLAVGPSSHGLGGSMVSDASSKPATVKRTDTADSFEYLTTAAAVASHRATEEDLDFMIESLLQDYEAPQKEVLMKEYATGGKPALLRVLSTDHSTVATPALLRLLSGMPTLGKNEEAGPAADMGMDSGSSYIPMEEPLGSIGGSLSMGAPRLASADFPWFSNSTK